MKAVVDLQRWSERDYTRRLLPKGVMKPAFCVGRKTRLVCPVLGRQGLEEAAKLLETLPRISNWKGESKR